MPQRKTKTIVEETEDTQPPGPAESPEEIQIKEDIENFTSALGPEVNKCSVYRLDIKTGKYAYCGALPISNATPGALQETYGAGDFMIRMLDAKGRFLAGKSVVVEAPPAGAGPALALASPIPGHFEMLQSQLARQQELIIHLIDSRKSEPAKNDLVEVIEAVGTLRALAQPQNQMKELMTALTEGLKLGMSNNGGSGSEDKLSGFLRVVEKFGEMLPRVMGRSAPAAPDPPPGPGMNPPAPAPGPDRAQQSLEQLRGVIGYLKTKISKDPDLWAEWIADNLEEAHWSTVAQLIEKPYDEISRSIGDPDLDREPFKSWFMDLIEALRERLSNNAPIDTDTIGPGRDSRSHGPNGPISKG